MVIRQERSSIVLKIEIVLLYIISSLAFHSCTDAGLQPILDEVVYVDDKLSISGQFCTSPADEVSFPVKILIVMDQSASLQCTDAGNNRLRALRLAGESLDPLDNVQFGVIGFASWSRIVDFTKDWPDVWNELSSENAQAGPATDYQGSLSTVLRVLEQDMLESGAAERARTKYVVLFLSDGLPEPRCTAGCDDGETTPDSLYGVCNTTEEIPDDVYVDMLSLCPDYNQPEQVLQKVEDIMSLGKFYGVGDLKFNTIFLFASDADVAAVCGDVAQFGYVKEEAEPMLRSMAETGLGTFRDVNISEELDFLDFDYESLMAPYEVAEFFAINTNTLPTESGISPDSDRDGLDDAQEFEKNLNRLKKDSDGDLFSDLFEVTFQDKGFDPLDMEVPAIGCASDQDLDADGLKECEEIFLTTNPLLPDSDGDRIPDGIELRLGLDPTIPDTFVDHDFDGRLSGVELRSGTNPRLPDEENTLFNQILYNVSAGKVRQNEIRCYDFSVQGITLVKSLKLPGTRNGTGLNRILLFVEEEPMSMAGSRGRFYVACVEAQYLGDTYKNPPSGLVEDLPASRFVEIQLFDPARDCLKPGELPNGRPDGGTP